MRRCTGLLPKANSSTPASAIASPLCGWKTSGSRPDRHLPVIPSQKMTARNREPKEAFPACHSPENCMNQLSQRTRAAIQALQQCHTVCHSMAMTHCLEMGGEHARPQHLRLMLDCAGTCAFTADALGRKSQFQAHFAALCAQVCETCGEDCDALGDMEDCVHAC